MTTSISSQQPRILIAEDEESFIDALTVGLSREGFVIEVAHDGLQALEMFESHHPDLILLDLMLPRMSGIDVCRTIRARSNVPIIMVTAKATEIDTVVGLEVGADDYVVKPFRLRELVARIRAVLRRTANSSSPSSSETNGEILEIGELRLDTKRHEVAMGSKIIQMPLKEFELLEILMRNAGNVLTRDMLIERVWGSDYVGDTKTLDVHIKRLRARIEADPTHPQLITTIRGLGYRFELPTRGK
ncbi:MAG: response regulator transcription factor [Actinobacteria bacterium]|nr:response regulator transcription factor [Actinomycetota bacterium]MCL6095734.1 response regulator transcription factor [Actinomycetota bacterium]